MLTFALVSKGFGLFYRLLNPQPFVGCPSQAVCRHDARMARLGKIGERKGQRLEIGDREYSLQAAYTIFPIRLLAEDIWRTK